MSKRAEEKALEAYPELLSGSIFGPLPVDLNKACREKYQEGYEQAEKDTIERAVAWLKDNAEDYAFTCLGKEKLQSRLWDDLKQAMEEEK